MEGAVDGGKGLSLIHISEPETQAIRTVTRKFKPLAILHWHGWGNDLAFPYSYDWRAKLAANELGLFQEFASEMTATNGYAYGCVSTLSSVLSAACETPSP